MSTSDVPHIYEVEAGVEVEGDLSGQEVDDDLAGRGRFAVAGPDHRRGVHDHDVLALRDGFAHELLSLPLGPLVAPAEVTGLDLGVLGRAPALRRLAHAGHAAGVNHAPNPSGLGGREDVPGPPDVGLAEGAHVLGPEGVVGCGVEHDLDPVQSGLEGGRVADVALDPAHPEVRELLTGRGWARQAAHGPPVCDEGPSQPTAYEPGRAGHERFQVPSSTPSCGGAPL